MVHRVLDSARHAIELMFSNDVIVYQTEEQVM
jgi:hypothetical protein